MYNYIYCVQGIKRGADELTAAKITIPSTMANSQNWWFGYAAQKFTEKFYKELYAIISITFIGCKPFE